MVRRPRGLLVFRAHGYTVILIISLLYFLFFFCTVLPSDVGADALEHHLLVSGAAQVRPRVPYLWPAMPVC